MKPPVKAKRPRPRSIAEAITQVLSTNRPERDIHPSLLGGRNNPVQLGAVSSVGGRLPQRAAERIFSSVDAGSPEYYESSPMRAAARKVLNGDSIARRDNAINAAGAESVDGFARYLGLPQPNRSLEPSPHNPARAKERGVYVRAPRAWDAILSAEDLYFASPRGVAHEDEGGAHYVRRRPSIKSRDASGVRMILDAVDAGPARISGDALSTMGNQSTDLLANFTMDHGEDENGPYVSLYDRYDLDRVPLADRTVGRPFEIYDRMYYDPATYEPRRAPRVLDAITNTRQP